MRRLLYLGAAIALLGGVAAAQTTCTKDCVQKCTFSSIKKACQWVAISSLQGPQGPQGPQGVQGQAGANGDAGTQGAIGPAGPQGLNGTNGAAGQPGETGSQGPKGDPGAQGIAGTAGPMGPQGPAWVPPSGITFSANSIRVVGTITVCDPTAPKCPQWMFAPKITSPTTANLAGTVAP